MPLPKKVSKSTLSMYQRTRCDKELFLSLHDKDDLAGASMPVPLKRAGIGRLAVAGDVFELERNDQLVRVFGGAVHCRRSTAKFEKIDLQHKLATAPAAPAVLLQPEFCIDTDQPTVLAGIGLSPAEVARIPRIVDCRPDVLIVRDVDAHDTEVVPNGSIRRIDPATETRQALTLLDIKHTAEANASYSSEVAFYTLLLAQWLALRPALAARYFVAGRAFIWSRKKLEQSRLVELENTGGGTPALFLRALLEDAEDAFLPMYLPGVRTFLENVARVIDIADGSTTDWEKLTWHVRGACASCDWLGEKRHLNSGDRSIVDANPRHYCTPRAHADGHLSLVPGITRGAGRMLEMNKIGDATALAGAAGHPALQQHTVLKREARSLPRISNAILANTLDSDANVRIASLDDYPKLRLYVSVNFDPSSGLLTGLAVAGSVTTYQIGVAPTRFATVPYIVDQKTTIDEWTALYGFLNHLAQCIQTAETVVGGSPTGQIHFWDRRQFEELCHAIGRHLPRVLNLTAKRERALAWLFPPDEILTHPDALEASSIVCLEDIVQRAIFTPTPHAITLFGTAEHYAARAGTVEKDSYYREYLADGIPRERIYEIWSNEPLIPRGSAPSLPRNTAIARFGETLKRQVTSLETIAERLRADYKGKFRAKSPHIPTSVPSGRQGVAQDAKLWTWWDRLNFQATQLEAHMRLGLDGERLEATYEAVVLENGRALGGGVYEFDVPASSREAKLTEDSVLALGKLGRPGLPLEKAKNLLAGTPPYPGDPSSLDRPLWSALKVTLLSFDRAAGRAQVRLSNWSDTSFVPHLVAHASINLLHEVFLAESKRPAAFNWGDTSTALLQAIGIPPVARPDPNAARAIGQAPRPVRPTSPDTPAARVLWAADAMAATRRLPAAAADAMARSAQARWGLNDSQRDAIAHALGHALTVIWGPPGTGKTNTLAALLHEVARDAHARKVAVRALVAGPTYKAVLEVMNRALSEIVKDPQAPVRVMMGYSADRLEPPPAGLPAHVQYSTFDFGRRSPALAAASAALATSLPGLTLVGSHIRHPHKLVEHVHGTALGPLFDLVVLDESSQITVSHALAALAGLTDDGRLIVAGDHLQMPPITTLEPPEHAEYLVGSIQTYLLKRPFAGPVVARSLELNYRSAGPIVRYLHGIGYKPTLQAVHSGTRLHLLAPLPPSGPPGLPHCPDALELLDPTRPVVSFVHEDEVSSQGNRVEAQFVASLVWQLRQAVSAELDGRGPVAHRAPTAEEFWNCCVGIVTPHRAQRALVVLELQQLFPGEAADIAKAVDTVERFQGGQRHTIIVTFGVADIEVIAGEEAFLMQLERMNVAVSRAMAKCIVVMPNTLATHIPEDRRALVTAYAVKDYVETYCDTRRVTMLTAGGTKRPAQIRYRS